MRYLLDSHVFLWYDNGDRRLGAGHRATLDDRENELFLSAASIWELAIKRSLGRIAGTEPFSKTAERLQMKILPVMSVHAEAVEQVPRLHRDPFDHLLIAQALMEGLVLVTHDRALAAYNVPMLRV